jgi:site-specific recombinase XerD
MEVLKMENSYISYLEAMHKSENTIKSYNTHINEMLNIVGKSENEIKYVDLLEWMKKISNNSPATINLKISAVKNYFKYLKKIEKIESNPAAELEKVKDNPKEKQYVSAEDMKSIIQNMYTAEGKAIVALMASTGLRYTEMANITLDEYINALATDRSIVIVGKGNKERKIFINDSARFYIDQYLSKNYKNKKNTDKLFVSADESALRKSLIRAATKANLPYAKSISPHWIRMFFATNSLEHGVDLATIRDALGHSNITVTSRYVKSCDNKIKNVMSRDMIFNEINI